MIDRTDEMIVSTWVRSNANLRLPEMRIGSPSEDRERHSFSLSGPPAGQVPYSKSVWELVKTHSRISKHLDKVLQR
jgi:hypothetical protein